MRVGPTANVGRQVVNFVVPLESSQLQLPIGTFIISLKHMEPRLFTLRTSPLGHMRYNVTLTLQVLRDGLSSIVAVRVVH